MRERRATARGISLRELRWAGKRLLSATHRRGWENVARRNPALMVYSRGFSITKEAIELNALSFSGVCGPLEGSGSEKELDDVAFVGLQQRNERFRRPCPGAPRLLTGSASPCESSADQSRR